MRFEVPGVTASSAVRSGEAAPAARRSPLADAVTVSFACADRAADGPPKLEHAAWVPKLRHIARARLSLWGIDELIDPAELLISELVTNAVTHGRGNSVHLLFSCTPGPPASVRIEVDDGAASSPCPKSAGPYDEGGRGLRIVEMITEEYGGRWGTGGDGRIWCTLATPVPRAARPACRLFEDDRTPRASPPVTLGAAHSGTYIGSFGAHSEARSEATSTQEGST